VKELILSNLIQRYFTLLGEGQRILLLESISPPAQRYLPVFLNPIINSQIDFTAAPVDRHSRKPNI
jgi:hypothetical protein